MKPWLVDVPVRVNIWIRPEQQKKQWEVIKQARPSILFIKSDGGRNEEEWNAIKQNRALIDNGVDWECEVHKMYENENLGLYASSFKMSAYIWERVDRCIFLEDDHIPSVSYFRFCAELLEKYKDDQRIEAVCGFNNVNTWDAGGSDYFFSRRGSIWGIATWRRNSINWDISSLPNNDYYTRYGNMLMAKDPDIVRRVKGYKEDPFYENHTPGAEFWHRFNVHYLHRLYIVVANNMITCEGATDNSTHSCSYEKLPDYLKPLFNSRRYELSFPIKHPSFIVCDEEYAILHGKSLGEGVNIKEKCYLLKRIIYSLRKGNYISRFFEKINSKKQEKSINRKIEK